MGVDDKERPPGMGEWPDGTIVTGTEAEMKAKFAEFEAEQAAALKATAEEDDAEFESDYEALAAGEEPTDVDD